MRANEGGKGKKEGENVREVAARVVRGRKWPMVAVGSGVRTL